MDPITREQVQPQIFLTSTPDGGKWLDHALAVLLSETEPILSTEYKAGWSPDVGLMQ
jgi:hypothetical protein